MDALSERTLVSQVCDEIRQRLDVSPLAPRTAPDPRLGEYVHVCLNRVAPLLDHARRTTVHRRVLAELTGLGVLELYLAEPDVTEVAVNNGQEVWVDRRGRMEHVDDLSERELGVLIERIIAPLGLRFDLTSPIVDARLPTGHRVCAVMKPLAVDGTCVSIRRFALQRVALEAFAPPPVGALLRLLIEGRCNMVVSGPASAGKTTLLNAITGLVDPVERIVTIEDTAELSLRAPHVVRLEARPSTPDGVDAVTVRQLLHAALRLRPDRLVVGEVRGAEAYDMVQALNTGHDGSLSTVHANSPQDAIRRITSLAALGAPGQSHESLDEQVRASIDVVVQVARRSDGERLITSIEEVARAGSTGSATTVLAAAGTHIGSPTRLRVAVNGGTP